MVGVDPRAMRRWCNPDNDKPMSPVAERLLFLMEATPAVIDMVRVIADNAHPARLKTVHDEETPRTTRPSSKASTTVYSVGGSRSG